MERGAPAEGRAGGEECSDRKTRVSRRIRLGTFYIKYTSILSEQITPSSRSSGFSLTKFVLIHTLEVFQGQLLPLDLGVLVSE